MTKSEQLSKKGASENIIKKVKNISSATITQKVTKSVPIQPLDFTGGGVVLSQLKQERHRFFLFLNGSFEKGVMKSC